jgi:hypothetical protein
LIVSLLYLLFRRALAVAVLRLRSPEFKLSNLPDRSARSDVIAEHWPTSVLAAFQRRVVNGWVS